jgi:hypothetical protein
MNQEYEANALNNQEASPFKGFFEFQKFQNTRRAILSGKPLYELNSDERQKKDYLDALHFNIQESIFAALPAVLIPKALDWIYENSKNPVAEDVQKIVEVFQGTVENLTAFFTPIILTLLASSLARASLRKADSTTEKINKAKKAYLYFDGAYGLYFQGFLSLSFSLNTWMSSHQPIANSSVGRWLSYFAIVLFTIGFFGQLKITWWSIPRRLFKANGYLSGNAPWFRYSRTLLFGVPILSFTITIVLAIFSLVLTVLLVLLQQK